MKAYFRCICTSRHKRLVAELKAQGYEIIVIKGDLELRREARQYKLSFPFVVENGVGRSL